MPETTSEGETYLCSDITGGLLVSWMMSWDKALFLLQRHRREVFVMTPWSTDTASSDDCSGPVPLR